jgi:cobalamin biosynthesis protein CobT
MDVITWQQVGLKKSLIDSGIDPSTSVSLANEMGFGQQASKNASAAQMKDEEDKKAAKEKKKAEQDEKAAKRSSDRKKKDVNYEEKEETEEQEGKESDGEEDKEVDELLADKKTYTRKVLVEMYRKLEEKYYDKLLKLKVKAAQEYG